MRLLTKKRLETSNKLGETHTRTTAKTVAYRIAHMAFLFVLAQLFGNSVGQASLLIAVVLVLGSLLYYLYDRLWLLTAWGREIDTGKDSHIRSLAKTIGYRLLIFFVAIVVFMIVLGMPLPAAIAMASTDVFSALIIYYLIERVFDLLDWGRRRRNQAMALQVK